MRIEDRHGYQLGTTDSGRAFIIPAAARLRHLHLIGQTGTGKSSALLLLMARHLADGDGMALLDPHGDLAEQILSFVPRRRAHELVYLNPADLERPIGFNVLETIPPDLRAVTADGIVAACIHIWGETSVGPRSQQVLRNALRALMDAPSATLLCVPRLLTHDGYRESILRTVQDPVVLAYWRNEFAVYDDRRRSEVTSPILNKLDALLSVPALRNIIAQPKSSIDLRRMMDEGRILIANLAKGAIGEGASHLLGALLVTSLARAALSRVDTAASARRPFHLCVDEFQSFANHSFALIMSEARKYALSLTLAHQYLHQLPDGLKHALLGNTGTFISFRVGVEDAALLAQHIGLEAELEYSGLGAHEIRPEQRVLTLPNFTAWARTLADDAPSPPEQVLLPPPPRPLHGSAHRLIANSRVRFGRPRQAIEAKIKRFLAA